MIIENASIMALGHNLMSVSLVRALTEDEALLYNQILKTAKIELQLLEGHYASLKGQNPLQNTDVKKN